MRMPNDGSNAIRDRDAVTSTTPQQGAAPPDPDAILRSRGYIVILVFGAVVGLLAALVAYFFLKWVGDAQQYVFTTLPTDLGFDAEPTWWPIPILAISGLLVGLTIHYLPGTSGHEPAEGFKASGPVPPIDLPGIIIASFVTLSLGVVLGPEAPLIAIGSGLGVLALHYLKRDAPAQAVMLIAAAGSFAAISTLLGSPLAGAFLLMEVAGVGAAMTGVVLVPGLLAAGIGALIFVGLDNLTGFGTFSLAVPDLPPFSTPTGAEFLWAIGIGLAAAVVGTTIRRLALLAQPVVAQRRLLMTPVAGLAVGVLAVAFAAGNGQELERGALLWTVRPALPDRERCQLDGGSARVAHDLQGPGLRSLVERLPWGPDVPGHVHRRRRWHRPVPPSRPALDRRRRHGHRGDDRRDAGSAVDLGPDHRVVPAGRWSHADATHHRCRGRGLRGLETRRARARRRDLDLPRRRPPTSGTEVAGGPSRPNPTPSNPVRRPTVPGLLLHDPAVGEHRRRGHVARPIAARNATTLPISSGSARRPSGIASSSFFGATGSSSVCLLIGVSTAPVRRPRP